MIKIVKIMFKKNHLGYSEQPFMFKSRIRKSSIIMANEWNLEMLSKRKPMILRRT